MALLIPPLDIRGYFYWSLLDDYEWMAGYGPRFGIIGVDRATQTRQIKPSALAYGTMARAGLIDRSNPVSLRGQS